MCTTTVALYELLSVLPARTVTYTVIVHGGRHLDIFEGPQAPDSTASYTTRGKIYTPLYPVMRMFYQVFSQTFLEEISKIEG